MSDPIVASRKIEVIKQRHPKWKIHSALTADRDAVLLYQLTVKIGRKGY
jgi:hypothetical protein